MHPQSYISTITVSLYPTPSLLPSVHVCWTIVAELHALGIAFVVALQVVRKAAVAMRGVEQRTVGASVDTQLVAAALFDAHDQRAIFGGQRAAGFAPKLGRVADRQAFEAAMDRIEIGAERRRLHTRIGRREADRKSTRLNSSH